MATIPEILTELVRRAADAAGHADAPVPLDPCVPTNDPRHGDYQSNFAFRLGKALRTNPREVAEAIRQAIPENDVVARAEVAGPGFLNLHLSDAWLARDVLARAKDPFLGNDRPGEGRTMVIDYSSPNIAKRMHVGHLRSTIIGNALDRLHRFLGWTVIADNHIGDWGTQFGRLIVAWHRWHDEAAYQLDPIGELQRLYQRFGDEAKQDPELDLEARRETVKLQEGDEIARSLWAEFVEASMREFAGIYRRLDVTFDVTYGESHYRDDVQPLVDRLLEQGVAERDEGAVVVRFGPDDGKGLEKQPFLVRKSDGAALYGTTDLAAIALRLDKWAPDTIVYVTDTRQQLHFRQLFAAARKLGVEAELVHVWFGILRLAGGAVASTRAGQVINLVDLLDSARENARAVVDAKSAELPEEERDAIAEAVGVATIKYADLSQNPQSDIVFDWERALDLNGNTAVYLMYAYARCKSIFRRAGMDGFVPTTLVLVEPVERELALAVARTPEAIRDAAGSWRPNLLCDHLFGLANTFARFYGECRVLGEDVPEDVTRSRLSLVAATAHALGTGFGLLGIKPLERM